MLFPIRVHIDLPIRPVNCELHLIVTQCNKQLTAFLTDFFLQSFSLVSDTRVRYDTFLVLNVGLDTIKHQGNIYVGTRETPVSITSQLYRCIFLVLTDKCWYNT